MSDERPLGLLPAPAAAAPTAVAPVAPKATWQGEAVEEGVGELEDQAAMLAHAELIRAAQQLTDEQVGQLVQQTRTRTKAARTQAAPSAFASTSKVPSSSSSEESEESTSTSDIG
jgi:hypothetical protein